MTTPTDRELADLNIRLDRAEYIMAKIWRLQRAVVNREQFNRLNLVIQKEITAVTDRVTALETDAQSLWDRIDDLL